MNYLQICTFLNTFFLRTWGVSVHKFVHFCTLVIYNC
nr:MAG TPA: hypothetical protein [Caudoviricetes sp.]